MAASPCDAKSTPVSEKKQPDQIWSERHTLLERLVTLTTDFETQVNRLLSEVAGVPRPAALTAHLPVKSTWNCSKCTFEQSVNFAVCEMCRTPRPLEDTKGDADKEAKYRKLESALITTANGTVTRINNSLTTESSSSTSQTVNDRFALLVDVWVSRVLLFVLTLNAVFSLWSTMFFGFYVLDVVVSCGLFGAFISVVPDFNGTIPIQAIKRIMPGLWRLPDSVQASVKKEEQRRDDLRALIRSHLPANESFPEDPISVIEACFMELHRRRRELCLRPTDRAILSEELKKLSLPNQHTVLRCVGCIQERHKREYDEILALLK